METKKFTLEKQILSCNNNNYIIFLMLYFIYYLEFHFSIFKDTISSFISAVSSIHRLLLFICITSLKLIPFV